MELSNEKQGNKNAKESNNNKSESYIHVSCKTSDKSAWVKAAKKGV